MVFNGKMGGLLSDPVLRMIKKIHNLRFVPLDALYLKHRIFEALGREPIIVYTMGKVGSTTVFHAFQKQYLFPLIYHVHCLTDRSYQSTIKTYKENDLAISDKMNLLNFLKGNTSHTSASRILMKPQIANSNRTWNIITLVRDPFSTFLSHVFQNPQIRRSSLLDENGILDREKVEYHIKKAFLGPDEEKDYISHWFDSEFYKATGVDLYQYPFNAEDGYSIIRAKRFNIAVISLESLDRNLPLIIKEFTNGSKDISLERKNVRTKKKNSGFYKELKNNIRVSREGLEEFYSTKYAKHFFTEEFRNRMVNKWADC